MKNFTSSMLILFFMAYPFCVYFGFQYFNFQTLILLISMFFILRIFFINKPQLNKLSVINKSGMLILNLIGILLCLMALLNQGVFFIKLYPISVSLALFIIFFTSLIYPPSIITQIAESSKKLPLSLDAINYTKKVTTLWCIFFFINAMIAFYTAIFSSMKIWTLYNGFISYLLIGSLFLIELVLRLFFIKKERERDD